VSKRGYALAMPVVALAVALLVGGSAAFGQQADLSQKVKELESLVKAQQQQIATLQQQLQQVQAGSLEQMRVEEIKKVMQELMGQAEFREKLLEGALNAGYKDGFFIKSGDDFMLKINGRVQMRYTFYNKQSRNLDTGSALLGQITDDRSGVEIERLRLTFSGYMIEPNLTYLIELQGGTDVADGAGGHDARIRYAWINYKFNEMAQVKIGLFKLPFGRQETTSSKYLMLVDRSLANEMFNLDRSPGIMLHGALCDGTVEYAAALSNGFRNADSAFDNPDATNALDQNPAITARVVWHALYDELGEDFIDESDLAYHKKPVLDVGLSFAYVDDNGDAAGLVLPYSIPDALRVWPTGYGLVGSTNGLNITQFGADAAFKYMGFACQAEWFVRMIDVSWNLAPWLLATGSDDTVHQQGAYVQAGYFIVPEKLEVVARLGGVWDIDEDSTWEYAGGVNYYLKGHNLKLQADVTKITELPVTSRNANFINQNDDILMWRIQLQAAF